MENLRKKEKDQNDVLMVLFYIGKLVEGGFIQGGPKVTTTGFDMAMDLKESGYLLDKETVTNVCESLDLVPLDGFVLLIMTVQELGLPGMLEEYEKMNEDE